MGLFSGKRSTLYDNLLVKHAECNICKKIDHVGNMPLEYNLVRASKIKDKHEIWDWHSETRVCLPCGMKKWGVKPCPCGSGFVPVRKK